MITKLLKYIVNFTNIKDEEAHIAKQDYPTDEDRMIKRLEIHRDLIGNVIKKLEDAGIESRRTTGNDSSGDILIVNESDVPKVQEIVRNMNTDSQD